MDDLTPLVPHPHQLNGTQKEDIVDDRCVHVTCDVWQYLMIIWFSLFCSVDGIPLITEEMLKKEFFIPSTDGVSLSHRCVCVTMLRLYCTHVIFMT